ncbi:hypothetical protein ACFQI7_15975 [Paenibacillus allorhizosphaerae]|uniref:EXPERA domain-containing protein n=1 Tax=Paenibacillus allorhizosphaerae TaxID=2849866 RepID=A0ABN7THW6_9BACL|nr:hypothetical protein [Paenibacillus allorhizosphaerae]CAG7629606.1 hypothetical protein PAECIP111802_01571 [Paenibacillus allorhizosphaerae]
MILFPPVRFDANEWFIICAALANWSIWLSLPRRFSLLTVVCIWIFNYCLAQTADFTIAVNPYDLYDYGDHPEFEYFDWVMYVFTYPPAAFFVLFYYDRWRLKGWKLAGYVIGCAILTNAMEWISAYWFHVFTYKGWNPFYSTPVYVLVYYLNIALLKLVQRYVPRRTAAG